MRLLRGPLQLGWLAIALVLCALCLSCQRGDVGTAASSAAAGAKLTTQPPATTAAPATSTSSPSTSTSVGTQSTTVTAAPTTAAAPVVPTTIVGSQKLATRTYPLTGFDKIGAEAFTVEVSNGPFSVSITADDNIFDRLVVKVDGQQLLLGVAQQTTLQNVTLTAKVSLPELTGLDAAGSAKMTATGFSGTTARALSASGASLVNTAMDSGNLQVDVAGGSTARLSGRCNGLRAQASGASHVEATALSCASAVVDLSGASDGNVSATTVQGQVSGASHLLYGAETTSVSVDASGASTAGPR